MNNDFVEFLRESVDEKTLQKICFRFGGSKVYIPKISLTAKILKAYEATTGSKNQRINLTQIELRKQSIYVDKNKIRWTINNGEKRDG